MIPECFQEVLTSWTVIITSPLQEESNIIDLRPFHSSQMKSRLSLNSQRPLLPVRRTLNTKIRWDRKSKTSWLITSRRTTSMEKLRFLLIRKSKKSRSCTLLAKMWRHCLNQESSGIFTKELIPLKKLLTSNSETRRVASWISSTPSKCRKTRSWERSTKTSTWYSSSTTQMRKASPLFSPTRVSLLTTISRKSRKQWKVRLKTLKIFRTNWILS